MNKKIISFIIFLLLIFMTGCLGPQNIAPQSTVIPSASPTATVVLPTPTATISVDPSSLSGTNIIFMYPWTGDVQTVVESLVDEFNRTNQWGIKVITVAPGSASALSETVAGDLQNFSPPEVIAAPIDFLLRLNQNSKVVADLTPYVESPQWGLSADEISYFSPVFWDQDAVNGYRYGIPAQRTAKVMVYNQTWSKELGYTELPSTTQLFQAQTCDVAAKYKLDNDKTNDGLGGWIVDTDAMTVASWLQSFGADLQTNSKISFNNASTIDAFQYLRGLLDNNCAWISKKPAPFDYFAHRQTLIYSADLQDLFLQQKALSLAAVKDDWVVLPFPSDSGPFILSQGPSYAILATSDEKKLAAWLFIHWMSNVDHQGKIIKASGTLPLGDKSVQYAIELEDTLPQWAQVVNLLKYVQVPPSSPDWSNARIVMEDASWQLFNTDIKVGQIPDLVKMMDQTMTEISTVAP